jgi:Family of unknown function (DUF6232)
VAEQTFLSESGVYISNTRVVIHGTTYSTANITSVRTGYTAASTGCATVLIIFGVLAVLGGLGIAFGADSEAAAMPLVFGLVIVVVGIAWFKSQVPLYHVILATAAGERPGLSSRDGALVSRVTAAVADAIAFRG